MVIARAYRHTEKLLQDNKEKLTQVGSQILIDPHQTRGASADFKVLT